MTISRTALWSVGARAEVHTTRRAYRRVAVLGSNGSIHPLWRSTPHGDSCETWCAIAGRTQRWRDSLAFDALGNITASAGRAGTGTVTYTNNRLTAREELLALPIFGLI